MLGVSTLPHSAICILDLGIYPLIRNGGVQNTMGVQFTIQGGSVFNKGVQYTMDVNRPRVQFTMGFKIPYDTGSVNVFFLGETNSQKLSCITMDIINYVSYQTSHHKYSRKCICRHVECS